MKPKEKKLKEHLYDGLGFIVVLENVVFHQIRGEWLPKIDVEELATRAFKLLLSKPAKLTGNEIRFIRTYMNKSKPAFAEVFKLSHTAVTKWEKVGDAIAPISPSQEMVLRLHLEDSLNVSNREFYQAYKVFEASVHSEDDAPLRIAL